MINHENKIHRESMGLGLLYVTYKMNERKE